MNKLKTDNSLYDEAVKLVREYDRGSVYMIQRRLQISYPQALCLIEKMTKNGVLGPENGESPREVLEKKGKKIICGN